MPVVTHAEIRVCPKCGTPMILATGESGITFFVHEMSKNPPIYNLTYTADGARVTRIENPAVSHTFVCSEEAPGEKP